MPDLPKTSIPLPHEAAEMFRLMAEEIEEAAIFLMDTQGIITVWNKAAQTIKGYSAEEAVGQFFGVLYTDDDQARGWPNHNLGLAQAHGYYSEENWRKKKDGSLFWARAALTALRDPQGLLLGFSKVTLDLTRHKQLEECLDEKEETRRIMQAAKAGTWKWNALNQELALSPPLLALLGYDQDELAPNFSAWTRLVHPPDLPGMLKKLQTVLDRRPNVPLASDVRLRSKDGACRWFYLRADWHRSSIDQSFMLMGVCVDINDVKVLAEERERLFRQLQAEKERAQVTLAAITNGVITTALNGAVDSMNTAAERLTGWSRAEALGRALAEIFHIADETTLAPLPDPVAQCLHENRAIVASTHAVLMDRNGQRHAIEYSAAPLHLQGNRPDGAVLVIHDVAEARGLLQNLRYQASHDVLTGLINRREFSVRLQRTLDRNRQLEALPGALLYLDLDQFKIVNDTCGHAAGDDLLRQLSLAYGAHVRERDTLARVGGDEFALIVEHCTVAEAQTVAHKLLDTTRSFRYVCKEQSFRLGVSIGLIPINGTAATVEEALRLADHACYVAKETGRNRIFVQQENGAEMTRRRNDMYWVKRLGDAVRGNQLQLFYQPIHALGKKNGGLRYEILLRMKNDDGGLIGPSQFLPAAERYDIMPEIDRWVLDQSLAWLEAHPVHVARLELCTINLSQRTLADAAFQEYAASRIKAISVPSAKLCFEITETGAVANMHNTLAFIMKIKELGCCFALDDFGTGMASFAYLKQIPVDYVKIDGSFIQMITQSNVDFEMVRFTNDISHLMGRRTIAEFVNDAATLQRLREIGVDFAQGFMLGEPQPLERTSGPAVE